MDYYHILIPMLASITVFCFGGAAMVAQSSRKKLLRDRLQGPTMSSGNTPDKVFLPLLDQVGSSVASGNAPSSSLRGQLARAGFHGPSAVTRYLGIKILLMVAGVVLFTVGSSFVAMGFSARVLVIFAGAAAFFFIPNMVVAIRSKNRREEIRRHVPDMVDLFEICVSGGMGIDMAWNCVADEMRALSPLLADEMKLVTLEMHLGEERATAIRHMAARTGADELTTMVAVLVQAERYGTGVTEALRVFAGNMRELRSQRAEEQAEKMSVKMLFPMTVLIFPVVIIVAVGPAAITLVQTLGNR